MADNSNGAFLRACEVSRELRDAPWMPEWIYHAFGIRGDGSFSLDLIEGFRFTDDGWFSSTTSAGGSPPGVAFEAACRMLKSRGMKLTGINAKLKDRPYPPAPDEDFHEDIDLSDEDTDEIDVRFLEPCWEVYRFLGRCIGRYFSDTVESVILYSTNSLNNAAFLEHLPSTKELTFWLDGGSHGSISLANSLKGLTGLTTLDFHPMLRESQPFDLLYGPIFKYLGSSTSLTVVGVTFEGNVGDDSALYDNFCGALATLAKGNTRIRHLCLDAPPARGMQKIFQALQSNTSLTTFWVPCRSEREYALAKPIREDLALPKASSSSSTSTRWNLKELRLNLYDGLDDATWMQISHGLATNQSLEATTVYYSSAAFDSHRFLTAEEFGKGVLAFSQTNKTLTELEVFVPHLPGNGECRYILEGIRNLNTACNRTLTSFYFGRCLGSTDFSTEQGNLILGVLRENYFLSDLRVRVCPGEASENDRIYESGASNSWSDSEDAESDDGDGSESDDVSLATSPYYDSFGPSWTGREIGIVLKLNKNGRSYLLDGRRKEQGVKLLANVADDLDCIYVCLLENPSLCRRS